MHNKSWLIDWFNLTVKWLCKTLFVKKKIEQNGVTWKKWGHDVSYESEHLYYIPCRERWAKLQYNKTLPSSTDFYSAAAYKPM